MCVVRDGKWKAAVPHQTFGGSRQRDRLDVLFDVEKGEGVALHRADEKKKVNIGRTTCDIDFGLLEVLLRDVCVYVSR